MPSAVTSNWPPVSSAAANSGSQQHQASTRPVRKAAKASGGARKLTFASFGVRPGLGERRHQKIVRVGPLGRHDVLAAQIGERLDRAAGLHHDPLALRGRRIGGDIDEGRARRLRENRRRLPRDAEIDGARVQRLEQRRAGQEFTPSDCESKRRQCLVERSRRLYQQQGAVFLVAEVDGATVSRGRPCRPEVAGCRHGGRGQQQRSARNHRGFLNVSWT